MFFLYTYIFKKKDEIESGGGGGRCRKNDTGISLEKTFSFVSHSNKCQ